MLLHLGQGQVSPVATDSCTDSSSVVICVAYTSIPFSECVGIHTARFYLGKGGFPHTRHFDIGNLLVLDNPINGKPLVGRYKFFFSRTMYWRANSVSIIAARVAGVPIPASFRLAFSSASSSSFSGVLHCGKQAAFRVQRFSAWSAFQADPRRRVANILPLGAAAGWRLLHHLPFPARRTRYATR